MRKFKYRPGTSDWAIWLNIHENNEYELPDSLEGQVVLDIGCHTGAFSAKCIELGAKIVYGFEPDRDNYKLATENLAIYNDQVYLTHGAVWRSDQQSSAFVHLSAYPMIGEEVNTGGAKITTGIGQTTIEAYQFDHIVRGVLEMDGQIDLVKLDCEGAEWPILFTSETLHLIDRIIGEYHEYGGIIPEDSPRYFEVEGYTKFTIDILVDFLADHGFITRHYVHSGSNLGMFFAEKIK